MDWRIPEKLKKGVSYARFSIILRSRNGNVKRLVVGYYSSPTPISKAVFLVGLLEMPCIVQQIRQQTEWQELKRNFSSQAMTSTSAPRRDEPTAAGKRAKPTIRVIRGPELSEEGRQQMIDEVWDFAAGSHLEWKPIGRTPAGRKCKVLMFNGAERVLVSLTSIEVSK